MSRFLILLGLTLGEVPRHSYTLIRFVPEFLSGEIPSAIYFEGVAHTLDGLLLVLFFLFLLFGKAKLFGNAHSAVAHVH